MIVVAHVAAFFGWTPGPGFAFAANAGVSLFFVLSGFVLAYNYPVLGDRAALHRFWVLRFARIWPLHAAVLLAAILALPVATLVPAGVDPLLAGFLSFALLQSWVPINGYSVAYNGPAWTLSVDVFFYAIFPWLLAPLRRAPGRTLAVVLLLALLPPLFANKFGGPRSDLPLDQWNWYTLDHFFPLARVVEFVLGMAASRAFVSLRPRMPRGTIAATGLEVAALVACVTALAWLPLVPYAALWTGPGIADWLTQVAAAPAFALLFVALAPGHGAISRVLATRPAVHLGELSYATYLLHAPFSLLPWWYPLMESIGGAAAAAVYAVALLGTADLAWRHLERPVRLAIVRAYDRRALGVARGGRAARSEPMS